MRLHWLNFILLFVLTSTLSAQSERVRRFTETLCAPEMHGRGYVNGGDSLAANFIAQQFYEVGLLPFFPNYFQSFRFQANTFPGKIELKSNEKVFKPGIDFLVDASSAACQGTFKVKYMSGQEFLGSKVVFVSKSEVLVVRNVGYSPDSTRKITEKLHQQVNKNVVIELINSKLMWSVSGYTYPFAYLQVIDETWNKETNEVSIEIETKRKNHEARNVVGWIPARKKKSPYLFITAHYDHLGRMGQETFFPGANDNASGCGMLLELAERLRKNPIKNYHVVFIAFAGEEIGLLGSAAFVKNCPIPFSKIRFLLNLDIMGSGEDGITAVNGSVFTEDFERLLKLNEGNKFTPQIKKRGKAANSDHHFFTEQGVSCFFVYTSGSNKHYHDVNDTFNELSWQSFKGLADLFEIYLRGF